VYVFLLCLNRTNLNNFFVGASGGIGRSVKKLLYEGSVCTTCAECFFKVFASTIR